MPIAAPNTATRVCRKSVDQAEKAISSFMESANKSISMVPGPMTEVAKQALAVTEAGLTAQFAFRELG